MVHTQCINKRASTLSSSATAADDGGQHHMMFTCSALLGMAAPGNGDTCSWTVLFLNTVLNQQQGISYLSMVESIDELLI